MGNKLFDNNSKEKNVIMCKLVDSELVKVMVCKIGKEICDKLKGIHEGDNKIK